MALLDDIRASIHEFANASDGMVKRSGDILEIQKIKIQIGNLEGDLKNLYAGIGEYYIDNCDRNALPSEFNNVLIRIDECREAIAQLNARISSIRGVTVCSSCGKEVPDDALFCPNCGSRIERAAADTEEAADTEQDIYEEVKVDAPADADLEQEETPSVSNDEPTDDGNE